MRLNSNVELTNEDFRGKYIIWPNGALYKGGPGYLGAWYYDAGVNPVKGCVYDNLSQAIDVAKKLEIVSKQRFSVYPYRPLT